MPRDTQEPVMSRNSADSDRLSELLAEGTERTAEEIERGAEDIEIENPEDAESAPLEEDWEDSRGYQDY